MFSCVTHSKLETNGGTLNILGVNTANTGGQWPVTQVHGSGAKINDDTATIGGIDKASSQAEFKVEYEVTDVDVSGLKFEITYVENY